MQDHSYLRPAVPRAQGKLLLPFIITITTPIRPGSSINNLSSIAITAPPPSNSPNLNLSSITNTMSGSASDSGTEGEMAPEPMYRASDVPVGAKASNEELKLENERLRIENAKLKAELAKNGSQIPAQFIGTSYLGTKRKVEEEMYATDQLGNKRLRTTDSMAFEGLSDGNLDGVCSFVSTAQNEVLRVAAKGGLINHLHFKITARGILGITPLGMERIDLFHRSKTEPKLIEDWESNRGAEFSNMVREIITESRFQDHSHPSLHYLAKQLEDGRDLSMGNLRKHLIAMEFETKDDVTKLEAYVKEMNRTQLNGRRNGKVDKKDLLAILRRISRSPIDGSVRPYVRMIQGDEGLRMAFAFIGELEKIVNGYHALYAASVKIESSIKVPTHYFAPAAPRTVEDESDSE
ncbi:unnamed protein product [Clonostachys rosea f. rosea IK726]|uniref:Uncharacterized protein n=1 Tax=Clonostachys rosea f. rosea IK726 TaxID=1349383 RepID=A0ACA9TL33_BIOOC|nr:unnamed protein product [Clonostachys rosea f. rosea IK726]